MINDDYTTIHYSYILIILYISLYIIYPPPLPFLYLFPFSLTCHLSSLSIPFLLSHFFPGFSHMPFLFTFGISFPLFAFFLGLRSGLHFCVSAAFLESWNNVCCLKWSFQMVICTKTWFTFLCICCLGNGAFTTFLELSWWCLQ